MRRYVLKGLEVCCLISFFFQAEDGIRDYKVTGVQTCALPIYGTRHPQRPDSSSPRGILLPVPRTVSPPPGGDRAAPAPRSRRAAAAPQGEIGRASCRERV